MRNLENEILDIEEYLMLWFKNLPFVALHDIFGIDLLDKVEPSVDDMLDEIRNEWCGYYLEQRVSIYEQFKNKYSL